MNRADKLMFLINNMSFKWQTKIRVKEISKFLQFYGSVGSSMFNKVKLYFKVDIFKININIYWTDSKLPMLILTSYSLQKPRLWAERAYR